MASASSGGGVPSYCRDARKLAGGRLSLRVPTKGQADLTGTQESEGRPSRARWPCFLMYCSPSSHVRVHHGSATPAFRSSSCPTSSVKKSAMKGRKLVQSHQESGPCSRSGANSPSAITLRTVSNLEPHRRWYSPTRSPGDSRLRSFSAETVMSPGKPKRRRGQV